MDPIGFVEKSLKWSITRGRVEMKIRICIIIFLHVYSIAGAGILSKIFGGGSQSQNPDPLERNPISEIEDNSEFSSVNFVYGVEAILYDNRNIELGEYGIDDSDNMEKLNQLDPIRITLNNPNVKNAIKFLPDIAGARSILITVENRENEEVDQKERNKILSRLLRTIKRTTITHIYFESICITSKSLLFLSECKQIKSLSLKDCDVSYRIKINENGELVPEEENESEGEGGNENEGGNEGGNEDEGRNEDENGGEGGNGNEGGNEDEGRDENKERRKEEGPNYFKIAMRKMESLTSVYIYNCKFKYTFYDTYDQNQNNNPGPDTLNNMSLYIEGQKQSEILGMLDICKSVKELTMKNNGLESIAFLQSSEDIKNKLKPLASFSLSNEPDLVNIDVKLFRNCPALRNFDLVGINPRIIVSTDLFTRDLIEVYYMSVDYHVYRQIGSIDGLFMKNKKVISVYLNGSAEPNNLFMKISAEIENPLSNILVRTSKILKVEVYLTEIERRPGIIPIRIPRSDLTTTIAITVHSNLEMHVNDMRSILVGLFNSCREISKLYFRISGCSISHKSINQGLCQGMRKMSFIHIENMKEDSIFTGSNPRPLYYKRGNGVCTFSVQKEQTIWNPLETKNPILYIVDTRNLKNWIERSYTLREHINSSTRIDFITRANVFPVDGPYPDRDQSVTKTQDEIDTYLNKNIKCQNHACPNKLAEIEIENGEEVFAKRDLFEYLKRRKNHSFIVLACGHYICFHCIRSFAGNEVVLYREGGMFTSTLIAVQTGLKNIFAIDAVEIRETEREKTQAELYAEYTGESNENEERIQITCPVRRCYSKSKTNRYYRVEEVEEHIEPEENENV